MDRMKGKEPHRNAGFTRMDLGALLSAGVLLAVFVLAPGTVRAGLDANAVACLNNLRRLGMAWALYAADNQGEVVNNFTYGETQAEVSNGTFRNWSHNILDWTASTQNTNQALARTGKLSPYHDNDISALRCPANTFASPLQAARGWTGRVRSYSMNGFMGAFFPATSNLGNQGGNSYAHNFRQFLLTSAIPSPAETMVFVEEHPDNVNDGYFVNSLQFPGEWIDRPAAYHEGGCGLSMADGSAVIRSWQSANTRQPVRYGFLPSNTVPPAERADIIWLNSRMSVPNSTMAVHRQTNDTLEIVWSYHPTTLRLQSMNPESGGDWQPVPGPVSRGYGRSSMTVATGPGTTLFRLIQ